MPERPSDLRTFIVLVEDVPGVLDRVASLFRRRTYNIESLTVGHTDRPGISRITIVMVADDRKASLVEANLYKLMNVLEVQDISDVPAVSRDLALIKIEADHTSRGEVMRVAEAYGARLVDVGADALIFDCVGTDAEVDKLIDVLRPYGILEMARTGRVAMTGASSPPLVAAATSEPMAALAEGSFSET